MVTFNGEQVGTSEDLDLRTIGAAVGCGCALCGGRAIVIDGDEFGAPQRAFLERSSALPYYVSALLPSGTPRWNSASSVGTAANVTFSFMTEAPSYASSSDKY